MKYNFFLAAFLNFFLLSISAQAKADPQQLKSCYVAAYKKIIVEIMGVTKSNTWLKNTSDQEFDEALNKTALYAIQKNGLIGVISADGNEQTVIYRVQIPEDLLQVQKGKILSMSGLSSRLGDALFYGLGNPNAGMYTPAINKSLNSDFSEQIKAVPECVGFFN